MSNKLTQQEYIDKLKMHSSELIPLEDYSGALLKIKHKCTCNKPFLIKPSHAYNNHKCKDCAYKISSIKQIKSNQEYLEELKELNIKVRPLEKYINAKTKILHKCTCGFKWKALPNKIKSGKLCLTCNRKEGVRKRKEKDNYPKSLWNEKFYENKPTILYYVKLDNVYKIGVCLFKNSIEKEIKHRFFEDIKSGVKLEIIKSKLFENGAEAYLTEQKVLYEFSDFRYYGKDIIVKGNSELFYKNII